MAAGHSRELARTSRPNHKRRRQATEKRLSHGGAGAAGQECIILIELVAFICLGFGNGANAFGIRDLRELLRIAGNNELRLANAPLAT